MLASTIDYHQKIFSFDLGRNQHWLAIVTGNNVEIATAEKPQKRFLSFVGLQLCISLAKLSNSLGNAVVDFDAKFILPHSLSLSPIHQSINGFHFGSYYFPKPTVSQIFAPDTSLTQTVPKCFHLCTAHSAFNTEYYISIVNIWLWRPIRREKPKRKQLIKPKCIYCCNHI